MEHAKPTSVLEQMHVRGQYERLSTDTAYLATELSSPQDVMRLTTDFDKGVTSLRDVGKMLAVQRTAILEAFEDGTINDMAASHNEVLSIPVENLHRRVTLGVRDQPIGHNFFVNASGFVNAELPWAKQFDDYMLSHAGVSIHDIAQSDDMSAKDPLLETMTQNPDKELTAVLAVYLAGRSLEGEKYLKRHYGEALEAAKAQVFETTKRIGATTGMRTDMLERAAEQLRRTTFGSFDHLEGLVTEDNSGASGDYRIGSLRVEVQYSGNVRSARLRGHGDAHDTLAHELHHAGSAQTTENNRCGLQIKGQGLEANEGMTEYLAQLSVGSPGIEQLPDGGQRIREGVSYRAPVFAMLALHEQFKAGYNTYFAVLFNAYHGDIRSQAQLEQALDVFYQHDATLADHLSR